MTKTRNLFAECLLAQLDTTRNDNKTNDYLSSMKISVPEPKVQTNYLECCYNIYGSPCTRFDGQSLHMPTFEPPQPYSRYPVTCTVPQYNFQMEPYVVPVTQPQLECPDQTVYYPEYDNMAYYNCINRRDMNERRSKFNFNTQGSVSSLCGESSKRFVSTGISHHLMIYPFLKLDSRHLPLFFFYLIKLPPPERH